MSRILAAAIETELAKPGISVLELVDLDIGNSRVFRFSDRQVPSSISHNGFKYTPRVLGIDELPFTVGAEDDSTNIRFWNGDLFFTNLFNEGVDFDGARLKVHRLFPDLAPPNNAVQDYWHGRITECSLSEPVFDCKVSFGFLELNRRALRRYEHTCNSLFADGLHCPYDPLTGVGLPQTKVQGTATGGSATTIVQTGKDFVALGVVNGWLVFNRTKKATGIVQSVSGSTITVDQWRNGGSPVSSDTFVVGPKYTACEFTKAACIARGMFGPNDKQTAAQLNTVTRRYFIGLTQPAAVRFAGKERSAAGKREKFVRTAGINQGLAGQPVPVVFGNYRKRELDLVGAAPAGEFLHSLFVIGEGRCFELFNPIVDGFPIDDVDPAGTVVQNETFMKYGIDKDAGSNDSSAVPSELTLAQQKQAVGARQSRAVGRGANLDTYADNPFLFNNAAGDGTSLAGMCAMRVRTEPEGGVSEGAVPNGDVHVIGLLTQMPPSSTPQADDGNVTDWTKVPNPIQVFYAFLRNTRWGSGLDDAQIDLAAVRSESDYCQALIPSSQSQFAAISGTVGFGPDDAATSVSVKNWVWIETDTLAFNLLGKILKITELGKEFSARIIGARFFPRLPDIVFDVHMGGGVEVPAANVGKRGMLVFIEQDFPSGKVPVATDTFEIQHVQQVRRFKAHGELSEDVKVGEMMQLILDNCAGTFIQDQGKISTVIRKAVDLNAVLSGTPVYTDKGAKRNVIRRDGESTFSFNPDATRKSVNSLAVEFVDEGADFQPVSLVIRDQAGQERLGKIFGEKIRDKREGTKVLALTNSRDQAARLGAIVLREKGPLPGSRPNGTVTFEVPIHDGMKLQPVRDVVPVASDHVPSYIQFVRVMAVRDNPDKMTMTIEARPHFNAFYDDTTNDLDLDIFPEAAEFPGDELPLPLRFESAEEKLVEDNQGNLQIVIEGEFTLPE